MRRTQILLEESQYRELKREALATGKALSEIVRECLASHLAESERDPLFDLVGYIRAENDRAPADMAKRHDAYLYGNRK